MQQLSFLPGAMTPGERSLIQRALKALDRHLHEPGVAFTSTHAAREWLILNMAGLEREEFRVLYLNNQNQLIAGETLFTGTINRTEVHPREVIKRALYHNAAAVVLAHNHPSGEVTPSKADRLITERLVQALALVDIRVPDHLIVGGSQGDGACFEGRWHWQPATARIIRKYAPQEHELHRIADALQAVQKRNFWQLQAEIHRRGRYCHPYSMDITVTRNSPTGQTMTTDAEAAVSEALRDLALWLYRQLENEHNRLTSDAPVDEALLINEYTFTEAGLRTG